MDGENATSHHSSLAFRNNASKEWPVEGRGGISYQNSQTTNLEHVVSFDGENDPLDPHNWPLGKKVYITALRALTTCWITFASSIYSAATAEISGEFGVSYNVANAGTSLLVFGFAVGHMVWAPYVSYMGVNGQLWRLQPYFISATFAFGAATAMDTQTILITRFFAGVFGSSPTSITGGSIVDIWAPKQRGTPLICYGITTAAAPTLGRSLAALSYLAALGGVGRGFSLG